MKVRGHPFAWVERLVNDRCAGLCPSYKHTNMVPVCRS